MAGLQVTNLILLASMTNSTDIGQPSLTDWIASFGTIIATFVAFYSIYITRRNERTRQLAEVFRLLDDNAHRNARRRIVNLYGEMEGRRINKILGIMGLKKEDIGREDAIYRESKEIVKADFNEIGSLLENKLILRNEFLKIYWLDVLRCWKVLYEEDIQPIRKQLHYDDYMASFEALKRFAESYKKTNVNQIHISKDVIIYPIITRTKPHRETTGVDLNSEIQIVFDEDMDENTINEQNIIVTEYESEKKVDGKLIWDSKNRTAVFKPSRCFGRGVAYNVTIKNEVRDKTGTQLKENDSWWFMTHNQP